MENAQISLSKPQFILQKKIIIVSLLLFGLIIALIILYIFNSNKKLSPAAIHQLPLNIQYAKNCPEVANHIGLIDYIYPSEGGITGAFKGIIKNLKYNPSAYSATFTLASSDNQDQQTFSINNSDVLVYDQILHQVISLSSLTPNMSIMMPYECKPKNNNQLVITQISVVKKY